MMIAYVVLPALICAIAALLLRVPLREASFITWVGHVLIGTGVPVLAGQGAALVVIETGGPEHAALFLAAGLSGGLGWCAGVLSARFTRPQSDD